MNEPQNETDPELDCQVTVNDGSYMTCDMVEDDAPKEEDAEPDYNI